MTVDFKLEVGGTFDFDFCDGVSIVDVLEANMSLIVWEGETEAIRFACEFKLSEAFFAAPSLLLVKFGIGFLSRAIPLLEIPTALLCIFADFLVGSGVNFVAFLGTVFTLLWIPCRATWYRFPAPCLISLP